jgi:hypothetical protein
MTIFYCLRFVETSLFVASYGSKGDGGGIRPRLHTGVRETESALHGILHSVSVSIVNYVHPWKLFVDPVGMEIVCCHGNAFVDISWRGNRCKRAVP